MEEIKYSKLVKTKQGYIVTMTRDGEEVGMTLKPVDYVLLRNMRNKTTLGSTKTKN